MSVAPLSDNAPQTTPSTVDDNQIQANQPTPTAQPPAQPTSAPISTTPSAPQPAQPTAPVATTTVPPRKALFDRVLQGLVGVSRVADPKTGEMSDVPMTRSTITKHILAGALTGIIAGAQAPPNPNDPAGTRTSQNMAALGMGASATQAKMAEMRNAPQARMDAQTLAKQRAMQNNLFEL